MTGVSIDSVDQWFQERWSRFTASENYKLMVPGKDGKVFSAGGMTYIKQKALEMVTAMWQRPELEEVESLLHGKVHELPAFEAYVRATKNSEIIYCGSENPIFLEYEPLKRDCGGSPDAICLVEGYDEVKADFGAEIKCPKNPLNHFERLKWKNQWDVAQNYPQAYVQIQNLMMITGAKEWDFVSYDDRMKDKAHKLKIITCHTDKRLQDNLHFRLTLAIAERKKMLQDYLGMI